MIRKQVIPIESHEFSPVRESDTNGVSGLSLIPENLTDVKVTLTHVLPSGKFNLHRDDYHHVFYVVKGTGEVYLGDETHPIEPGSIVEIPAGTSHGYQNTSNILLEIITINIPKISV